MASMATSASEKVEIQIERTDDVEWAADEIRVGQTVQLVPPSSSGDGALGCSTTGGHFIGRVPELQATTLVHGAWQGSIRSLKRDPASSTITHIQIRLQRQASQPPAAQGECRSVSRGVTCVCPRFSEAQFKGKSCLFRLQVSLHHARNWRRNRKA